MWNEGFRGGCKFRAGSKKVRCSLRADLTTLDNLINYFCLYCCFFPTSLHPVAPSSMVHGPCLMFALGVCSGCSFFTGAWKMAYWAWKGIARVKPDPHFHACSLLIGNWSEAGSLVDWIPTACSSPEICIPNLWTVYLLYCPSYHSIQEGPAQVWPGFWINNLLVLWTDCLSRMCIPSLSQQDILFLMKPKSGVPRRIWKMEALWQTSTGEGKRKKQTQSTLFITRTWNHVAQYVISPMWTWPGIGQQMDRQAARIRVCCNGGTK